ncbi:hypothetical protein FSARC_1920 [Fusarium sarcochroum]|uniref:Protein kinase domain-containing protein n=1 Tax=Fusarium sarcochroum TaxID=1208366 RepID=A0A8H4U825_9HYPO|nr:hypothetical protein FSARC_1920 [Fusarium sarcochroum]
MYPDRPESAIDLVPLPRCNGPKLEPFDFQGTQKIDFVEHIGEGGHSHVFKVKISSQVYALKLFRFVYDHNWLSPQNEANFNNHEAISASYEYAEPFNCECRAFGRLQEAGHEELATKCFGYILLDDEHEDIMMKQFSHLKLDFNGDGDDPGYFDMRSRFLGKHGRLPPIRGIVKEFGQADQDLQNRGAKRILKDIMHIQQLGIVNMDVAHRQIISGKVSDFSTAVTVPHFITNPELNPHLTPEWVSTMEMETFILSYKDYRDFDMMVDEWNDEHEKKVTVEALPGGFDCSTKHHLRNTPSRERVYSYVDPRSYKQYISGTGHQKRVKDKEKHRAGVVKSQRRRLAMKPPLWFSNCDAPTAEKLKRLRCLEYCIIWQYVDGHIAPLRVY